MNEIINYYSRKDVQREMLKIAEFREIGVRYGSGFGQRPDTLTYPRDIVECAKRGATSFHASEERWKNPVFLKPNMGRQELDNLRIGWDLIIDIDCDVLEYSKIAADIIMQAMEGHNIDFATVKFSGNHGFHIGIPFESFPEKIVKDANLIGIRLHFPESTKRIASYIKEVIREQLSSRILETNSVSEICNLTKKDRKDIIVKNKLDPFTFLTIDDALISSRHLFRMPYSINEKSGLVSTPLNPKKIMEFEKKDAEIGNVEISKFGFLDIENVPENGAREIFIQAFDFEPKTENTVEREYGVKKFELPEHAIPQELFPPCITLGLKGIEDGKKRFLFSAINFLACSGWSYDEIEKKIMEWNKKNPGPLRENYLIGQLRYYKSANKKILPPNCRKYYEDLRICHPDAMCTKIKNPVNYCILKARNLQENSRKAHNIKPQKNLPANSAQKKAL